MKKSYSAPQIAANRANAALSTGPVTAAGKEKVKLNAVRHGLTSKTLILKTEEKEEFEALRRSLVEHWGPANDHENGLIDELARETWRLDRVRMAEAGMLDHMMEHAADCYPDHDNHLGIVFSDPVFAKKLALFLRYQGAIERSYNRIQKEVTRVITERRKHEARLAQLEMLALAQMEAAALRAPRPQPTATTSVPQNGFVSSQGIDEPVGQASACGALQRAS